MLLGQKIYVRVSGSAVACFASAASTTMVRPPIGFYGVDGKYTNALYSAASKTQKVDKVEQDLINLAAACNKDIKFRDFMTNPLIKGSQKKEILAKLLPEKFKTCDLTNNMIAVMAETNRLKYLPAVARNYAKIMAFSRGELDCTIISAKPITDPKMKQELEAILKKFTSKKLTINSKIDPTILGGVVIDFGGEHYIDMSLRSKLKTYTDILVSQVN
ncbi:ATP synthase subunit O, mitochondrial-like [Panonychus citri]|uniref:ATP synthase subunit O, mitochondrial-like n=1 Tax=Panonychus citri TaxID=50023 RepID=UPI0023073702|nr:ATP synthase subunit O, mitochondrial-like [Panonychus citri]